MGCPSPNTSFNSDDFNWGFVFYGCPAYGLGIHYTGWIVLFDNRNQSSCVVFVDGFPEEWATTAAEIEEHSLFPNRTNVSYVRVLDKHTIEARFYERGAGETMSSGTGSMGAAVAAIARGLAQSPVKVITPAGPLDLRWEEDVYLKGPARIVARGEYYR